LNVTIEIYADVIRRIFAECNRFNEHETGGALIGFYEVAANSDLSITVAGVIDAGPNTHRTAVSLFTDGEYQEKVFRQIEARNPKVEHLGNRHTHHVNNLRTLSAGDCQTYHKRVNSPNHNTDFWYALLVTEKLAESRYQTKHYVLFRNDPNEYEIEPAQIRFTQQPMLTGEG
jgi:hypothetical protein